MKSFISKAISHVERLFPSIYSSRSTRGSYHFSLAFLRNKLICVGINDNSKQSPKTLKLAKQLGIEERILYPYQHAEEDMVGKLIGMGKLSSSLNVVVLRLNVFGELKQSQPCSSCQSILNAYSLNKVWWSNENGEVVNEK